jgi:hypothetical protein
VDPWPIIAIAAASLESIEGNGSTFSFAVPLVAEDA